MKSEPTPRERELLGALLVLSRTGPAYGVSISRLTRRSLGGIYVRMERMEAKGWVRAWLESGGAIRNFHPRKCWAITDAGRLALDAHGPVEFEPCPVPA